MWNVHVERHKMGEPSYSVRRDLVKKKKERRQMPLHCTLARGLDRQVPQKLFATEDELHVHPVGAQTSVHCKGARWLSESRSIIKVALYRSLSHCEQAVVANLY